MLYSCIMIGNMLENADAGDEVKFFGDFWIGDIIIQDQEMTVEEAAFPIGFNLINSGDLESTVSD